MLNPHHYKTYVGPFARWDEVREVIPRFLIETCGLQPHHRLVDIGCGTLRIGRPLINYLNRAHYTGLEASAEALAIGRCKELPRDLEATKAPLFLVNSDFDLAGVQRGFDFALAHEVFIHCGHAQLAQCAAQLVTADFRGTFILTIRIGAQDIETGRPHYDHASHEAVTYRRETLDSALDPWAIEEVHDCQLKDVADEATRRMIVCRRQD